LLSGLQQLYLGGAQSQQSWRALTMPGVLPPQTSPSGSQLCGLLQVPMGGFVPATMLQTMLPAPGPPTGPPQQSVLFVHASPMTRQPLATSHTCPPVDVVTHRRLQQPVPLEQTVPSTSQPPEPPALSSPHVPAVLPWAMLQTPVQQVAPE
jgi:hypothetical protein